MILITKRKNNVRRMIILRLAFFFLCSLIFENRSSIDTTFSATFLHLTNFKEVRILLKPNNRMLHNLHIYLIQIIYSKKKQLLLNRNLVDPLNLNVIFF